MVWLALYACMLQAQTVNLFDESSIGMGDSIDQVKYQVVYDAEYIYEKKYTKTDTIIGRIEEKCSCRLATSIPHSTVIRYSKETLPSLRIWQRNTCQFSGNGGQINWKYIRTIQNRAKLPISISLLPTDMCA